MANSMSNGFNGRPPGSVSMGINGQPASDFEVISQPPSSTMMNGSSVDLTNGLQMPVDLNVGNPNPLMSTSVTSGMSSITESTLAMALRRIQDLSRENEDLKDFLRQNNEMMKKQYDTLTEYKKKVHAANVFNKEKFEETKTLVSNLRAEKAVLKEENESFQRKQSDMEMSHKALTEHRCMTDSIIKGLQAEIDSLKQQISRETTQAKEDVVLVSTMGIPANEENAKLTEKLDIISKENEELNTRNERLRNDVRQYKATADQLLSDLEGTQALKSERETECKTLGKENAKLSSDVQKTLREITEERSEKQKLQQANAALLKQLKATAQEKGGDSSFEGLIHQSLSDTSVIVHPIQAQHTSSSQTTESLSVVQPPDSEKDFEESETHSSNPMADMLEQLRRERETVTNLRSVIAENNQEIQNLHQNLRSKEEVLLSKTTRFESSSADVTAEQEKAISDLRATTEKLEMATGSHNQMNSYEDINSLKSQVLTLINELHESQTKLTAATEALAAKNNKLEEVERQNVILSENLNRQRLQDDTLIESMREALVNKEEVSVREKAEHQATRKQLSELRVSFNQLVTDYRDLLDTYDEYRLSQEKEKEEAHSAPPANYQDEISRLTAQVIGSEEAIAFRDTQIQKLREELNQLKQEVEKVPVLRAQAEVYKSDFDAERKAREKQHAEKEAILQDMVNLQTQNQQLVHELESFSRNQFAEMQNRHASRIPSSAGVQGTAVTGQPVNPSQRTTSEVQGVNQPRGYPYPPGEHLEVYPCPERQQSPRQTQEPQLPPIVYPDPVHEEPLDFTALDEVYGCHHCPKCGLQCPDLDSLQIHVIECLDKDSSFQDPFRT